ncbi:hypothetical protein [Streptomyces luteireticuli]|uniref:hypothetical protein n=1 Tax=Streptomyces luteireticuli TaxID=173858 RepID=UPI003556E004
MNLVAVSTAPDTGLGERWPEFDHHEIVAATLVQQPRYVDVVDERWDENAHFIAGAREDIPRLIAEIQRLRRLLEANDRAVHSFSRTPTPGAVLDEHHLTAVHNDGSQESVILGVEDSGTPSITLIRADGTTTTHPGTNLFECLIKVRCALEADGFLLCCQGARPTVFPSGMERQMSNGRLAYPLRRDPPLTGADLVDIFLPAKPSTVGTVKDQRSTVMRFFGFTDKAWPGGSR